MNKRYVAGEIKGKPAVIDIVKEEFIDVMVPETVIALIERGYPRSNYVWERFDMNPHITTDNPMPESRYQTGPKRGTPHIVDTKNGDIAEFGSHETADAYCDGLNNGINGKDELFWRPAMESQQKCATPKAQFFMVYVDGRSAPNFKHDTFELAQQEAERLAGLNVGKEVFVLKPVLKIAQHLAPIHTEELA